MIATAYVTANLDSDIQRGHPSVKRRSATFFIVNGRRGLARGSRRTDGMTEDWDMVAGSPAMPITGR